MPSRPRLEADKPKVNTDEAIYPGDDTRANEPAEQYNYDTHDEFVPGIRLWSILTEDVHVTGTMVWYYHICRRQVWLMAHQITPDEDDPNIEFGRFLHKQRYQRDRKEYSIAGGRIDLVKAARDGLLIAEVKKSSRYEHASKMQMLFYLKRLKENGVLAQGELRIPEERKRIPVHLDEAGAAEIAAVEADILALIKTTEPPAPQKTRWCKNCGYREFCWS